MAEFGLEKWLNGDMVRTTLITEPHGSEPCAAVWASSPRRSITKRTKRARNGRRMEGRRLWQDLGEFRVPRFEGFRVFHDWLPLWPRFRSRVWVRDVWDETRGEFRTASDKAPSEKIFSTRFALRRLRPRRCSTSGKPRRGF